MHWIWEWLTTTVWHWMQCRWPDQCGGSTFVQTATGINLALISWDAFRQRLRALGKLAEGKRAKILSDYEDRHPNADGFFANIVTWIFRRFQQIQHWIWHLTYVLTVILTFAGIFLLYFNAQCPWDFVLLVPWFGYFLLTAVGWVITTLLALWMSRQLRSSAMTNYVNAAVDELQQGSVAAGSAPSGTAPKLSKPRKRKSRS